MKVKELIEKLQEYDEELEVVYCSYFGYDFNFTEIEYLEDGDVNADYTDKLLRIGSLSA